MASRRSSLERRRRELEDEIARRRSLLEDHKRNLYDFEVLIAKKGGEFHATLAEQRSRDEARRNVEETKEEIRRLEAELAASPVPAPPKPEPSPPPPSSPDELESSKRQIERSPQIQIRDVRDSEGVAIGQNIFQVIFSHASTILPIFIVLIPLVVIVVVLLAAIAGVIVIPRLKFGPTATPTKTPKPPPVEVVLVGSPTATTTSIPSPTPTRTPLPEARKLYYFLILDASSRMADGFEGSDSKWMAAQKSARDLLTVGLPSRANYGLIVLGGNQPGGTQTCDDLNQILLPLGLDQRKAVIGKIESLEPQGVASLTDAIALARDELLSLPGDLEKTIFVITGGGDTCQPDDEWESLLDLLELSVDLIKAKVDLIILADENVDEEVQAAVREIIRLDLENVRANVPSNEEELTNTMDDVADSALERARVVEPTAIAAEETAVAADRATAIAVVPTPTTPPQIGTTAPAVRPSPPTSTSTPFGLATNTPPPLTPTPTPTKTTTPPISTPTKTPTNTPTSPPPPTDTPSPTPTDTPISSGCQSSRPQLQGAASFPGKVEIHTPDNCTTGLPAETDITAAGTYAGISGDVDIWVLVYPPNAIYYPQSPNACEGEKMTWGDGNWQVPIYLGEQGGDPEWFDIVVILTDQAASQFLSDWVQQGCQAGEYSGIPAAQLEQMNITEKSYTTVQTQD